jgi:hypothetical protein
LTSAADILYIPMRGHSLEISMYNVQGVKEGTAEAANNSITEHRAWLHHDA